MSTTSQLFAAVLAGLPTDAGRATLTRGRDVIADVICTGIEQSRTQDDMGRLIGADATARYLAASEVAFTQRIEIGDKVELLLQGQTKAQTLRVGGRFPVGAMVRLVLQAEFE